MRVALVGTGGWGKNHARVLSQLKVLCAICDIDGNKSEKFGKEYNTNYYTSIDELIESEIFDAVVIATPTRTHYDIAIKFIKARKHVFIEKPITYQSKEGQILVELARRNKIIMTCGYIERFNPAVDIVKSHLKRHELITLEFHRENTSKINDIGIIHDTAVHDIDTANYLFGEMPIMVFGRVGSVDHKYEDYANIILGYKNNRTATISTNWIAPKKTRTLKAICTDVIITLDFISQEVIIEGKDNDTSKNTWQEPLFLEVKNFLNAIRDCTDGMITPEDAVNVTRIAEAVLLSSNRGVPIYLDLK